MNLKIKTGESSKKNSLKIAFYYIFLSPFNSFLPKIKQSI